MAQDLERKYPRRSRARAWRTTFTRSSGSATPASRMPQTRRYPLHKLLNYSDKHMGCVYPGCVILICSNPGSNNSKREGENKLVVLLFCSHVNVTELKIFEQVPYQTEKDLIHKKLSSQKIRVLSGIRKKLIPDPRSESRCQESTGSRNRIRDTADIIAI
jgi:hypothetical protein